MSLRLWGKALNPNDNLPVASLRGYLAISQDLVPKLYNTQVTPIVEDLVVTIDKLPLDYFTAGVLRFFSEELLDTVRPFCRTAEFVPVPVRVDGLEAFNRPFFLANIVEQVECLDEVNGRYTYWNDGSVHEIEKLAIDLTRTEGHDLFWVKRTVPILLCASQAVQDAVRRAGHTGIGFRDPEDWKIINKWH